VDNPGRKKWSIQKRVVLSMLLIGIIPGILVVALAYMSGIKALRNSIGTNFQEMAKGTADKVQLLIEDEIEEAHKLAVSPIVRESVMKSNKAGKAGHGSAARALDDYLKEYRAQKSDEFVSVIIIDRNGAVIDSAGRKGTYKGGQVWLRDTLSGRKKAYISGIEHKNGSEIFTLSIAVPVTAANGGAPIGALRLEYDIRELFAAINDVRMGETGHANLVSSDGTLIVCPVFAPQSHKINYGLMRQVSSFNAGWGVAADDAHGGSDSIIGYAPVRLTQMMGPDNFGGKIWYVFIRQLPRETYAPMYSLLKKIYLLGAVLVAVIIPLGVYASRKITRPIRLLTKGAELIGQGRLDHRITIGTGDEIQQMAETFNRMADSLEKNSIERGRYLKRIKKSEEKYRTFFDHAEDSMFLVNPDGEVTAVNKREEKTLGYSADSIPGLQFSGILLEKYRQAFSLLLESALSGEKPPTCEMEVFKKDGSHITAEMDLTGIRMGENAFVQIHLRDVTRRKTLEKEIILERNKLDTIIGSMGDGLDIVDMDYRIRFANKRVLELYGRNVAGRRCHEVYMGSPFPCAGCPIPEGGEKTGILEVSTNDGRAFMITYSPFNIDGVRSVLEIITDITEKKRLESTIEKLELYNTLFDYAEDSMFMVDIDGRITAINKREEEVIGYSKDSVVGQRFSSILAEKHRENFKKLFRTALEGRKEPTSEVEIMGLGGAQLAMEMDITSIKRGGTLAFVLVHLRDVTKRRELEQQLLMAERLTAVSHFSSALAHDLRNPIIGIKKTLTSLKSTFESACPPPASKTLSDLISGSELLLGMVNDVMDVHLKSYEELPLIISNFPLVEAVEEAIKLLRTEADEKKIKVSLESDYLTLAMHGDKRRLQRVFINLLDNAIKYSSAGSRISITFKPIEEEHTDYLLFGIEDEGIGIDPANLTRIFEPLYQTVLKKGSKAKIGTGLGLYFCKVVVEAHHGKIWAENRLPKGSRFFIQIPL